MRVVIAGSRGIEDYDAVASAIESAELEITEVISGGARGVDRLGERWARNHGIPCLVIRPDWDRHGKRAGFIRNHEMLTLADAVICVWDGQSSGTEHMAMITKQHHKPLHWVRI